MRIAVACRALMVTSLCLLPNVVHAQGGVVGSIIGNVFDQTGQPLSGVKVVAESPTQIGGVRVTYTNAEGGFRFNALQPGTFEVMATAPKMRTVHQKGIKVGVNAPAEVTLMMEVETATEEVKVIERAPIVSTTTANVKEQSDAEFVDNLPLETRTGSRSWWATDARSGLRRRPRRARPRRQHPEPEPVPGRGLPHDRPKTTLKSSGRDRGADRRLRRRERHRPRRRGQHGDQVRARTSTSSTSTPFTRTAGCAPFQRQSRRACRATGARSSTRTSRGPSSRTSSGSSQRRGPRRALLAGAGSQRLLPAAHRPSTTGTTGAP